MAQSYVARQMVKAGGQPILREGFVTDNGNHIIDVHNLKIANPLELETRFNQIAGVVTVGIFAQSPGRRAADRRRERRQDDAVKRRRDRAAAMNEVAGGLGFEPRFSESESDVLPLDDPPIREASATLAERRRVRAGALQSKN